MIQNREKPLLLVWRVLGAAGARLPLSVLRFIGAGLGLAVYLFTQRAGRRAHIAQVNASIFFPESSASARQAIVKRHFQQYGIALVDRLWLWFAPVETVYARLQLSGITHYQQALATGRPIILFVPHFFGLDAAWPALNKLCAEANLLAPKITTIYQPQSAAWQDSLFRYGRGRAGDITQFTRHDGIRPVIQAMRREARMYYCLPDNDFGLHNAVFADFFNEPAATVTVLNRLANSTGALVLPLLCTQTSSGYDLQIQTAQDFAGFGDAQGARLQNELIEQWVRRYPSQYLLSHRRYKSRPEGASPMY